MSSNLGIQHSDLFFIPAQAETAGTAETQLDRYWIPACTGMTPILQLRKLFRDNSQALKTFLTLVFRRRQRFSEVSYFRDSMR